MRSSYGLRLATRFLMALLLVSLQGGQAWMAVSVGSLLSRAAGLSLHTKSALQCRCGNSGGSWTQGLRRAALPLWTSSSCLFQSTATAAQETVGSSSNKKNSFLAPPNREGVTKILADDPEFVKPDPDLRKYRWIQLANNLQVLLVSTTETTSKDEDEEEEEQSHVEAAAVHVQAGHFDDTIPGLAHFNEHMLFLGTEKYPEENAYETFLSKYGGFSNAYTDMEDTNYYFSLATTAKKKKKTTTTTTTNGEESCSAADDDDETSEALEGSLDRLAQFFIAPKFETSMVDREINAIDSEWRNARTSDAWRNYQHLKLAGNQEHPFANFGCGNLETLTNHNTTSPRPALLDFWKTYYQTYNLRLAVVGYASLDALQASVERTFGELPFSEGQHRGTPAEPLEDQVFPHEDGLYNRGQKAFGPEQLQKYRQVIPVMETRMLRLYFASPPGDDPVFRESKPHRVISHLLGHESPGTLHSLLNDMGYIQALSSGMVISTRDFALFGLSLSLTPKGMANKDHVLDLSFQWLAMIKQVALDPEKLPLMEEYHGELKQMFVNGFKFRENGDPTDFCSTVAELMFDTGTPPERILIGNNDEESYDPKVTEAFLDRLKPSNCMVIELNSDLAKATEEDNIFPDGWQTEPWYGAQYRVRALSPEQMNSWENPATIDDRLELPGLNQYIPTDFSLRCDKGVATANGDTSKPSESERNKPPKMIMDRPGLRLWHKMDKYWRVPKAFIKFSLVTPAPYRSPRTMTLIRIYQRILNDDLKSTVYDASLAGCGYRVSCTPTGIRFSVQGYNEKLLNLLNKLTSRMLSLIDELKEGPEAHPALYDKFEKAKESLLRETKNYRLDAPYEVASYNSRLLLEENVWYLDDYVREMEGEYAEKDPLTMEECGLLAEESLTGRHKVEAFCMGNIDESEAREACQVVEDHFFTQKQSRPLMEAEIPTFRSMQLPTREEAKHIFREDVLVSGNRSVPLVYQEVAYSPSEENHAIEYIIQTGSEIELEYSGIALIELMNHIAYNSAYNQLRTKEQLGYIVSTFPRKTSGGGWGFSVVVQSSVATPEILEERVEAWLKQFRAEMEQKEASEIALEAAAVVSQLKERDTKLSQEVNTYWGEISNTETYSDRMKEPFFDRMDRVADELVLQDETKKLSATTLNGSDRLTQEGLKQRLLDFIDHYIAADSPSRRAMSARVYNQKAKELFEANVGKPGILSSFPDIRHTKQYLGSSPLAPYWRVEKSEG
ncbi:Insulin-degrading enzyme [Seminavis robusta]|uniref:Insulin-degrading enzyme n=1 Tax=Seminavis robusta TaxID=568900 RepID=A0A9N8ETZ2_9STRA|nr:Insulin-degrading enzyme [Seminavis robusta]|eukprot:Sro1958_g307860.1 Insulin-degrading enzyme (1239) ;mRNA; r:2971-6900